MCRVDSSRAGGWCAHYGHGCGDGGCGLFPWRGNFSGLAAVVSSATAPVGPAGIAGVKAAGVVETGGMAFRGIPRAI